MSGNLATIPTKCEHPLGFGYIPVSEQEIRPRRRHKHDLPQYDSHITRAVRLAKLWRLERLRHRRVDPLARLERAAKAANQAAFLEAVKEINWQRGSVRDFVRAVRLALTVGTHATARELAMRGAELHFDSNELEKYARVLAPPKVLAERPQSKVNPKANVEWLKVNKDNYRGKWIAIRNGEFLGFADTYRELVAQLGETKGQGILVTPIY
jgi:hypothetical protein